MASYNIVLNLTGTAVSQVGKLATALATANANAISLAASLRGVNSASAHMSTRAAYLFPRGSAAAINRPYGGYGSRPPVINTPPRTPRETRYTRHRATRIASFGTGFSFGGFSGRLSTILQPDEDGNILGMNATNLAKRLNIAAIAGNLASSIGKTLLKVTAFSTVAPFVLAGGGLMAASKLLNSEGFAEGVRLISRRHQAKQGLGADYEEVNRRVDELALSYGFDRSTSLSSMNVLTGLRVGKTGKNLNVNEATSLTKVGGIISQHHGVPYERVMTNIQQLLVQQTPHMRDIRELLNQAPILGKYAMKEMEQKGLKGVSHLDYLKSQANILSVLKKYEMDTASNAGMRARGKVGLAWQDFWAEIAGNDEVWGYFGAAISDMVGEMGHALNKLLTSMVNSKDFQIMVASLSELLKTIADNADVIFGYLTRILKGLSDKLGVPIDDIDRKARTKLDMEAVKLSPLKDTSFMNTTRKEWLQAGGYTGDVNDTANIERQFKLWSDSELKNMLLTDSVINARVKTYGAVESIADNNWFAKVMSNFSSVNMGDGYTTNADRIIAKNKILQRETAVDSLIPTTFIYKPDMGASLLRPQGSNVALGLEKGIVDMKTTELINNMAKKADFERFGSGGGSAGKDLEGFNRDKRSLEIHFHDKLVEWNSTITSNDPTEVLEVVSDNMEQLIGKGIQVSLFGATNKLNSYFG